MIESNMESKIESLIKKIKIYLCWKFKKIFYSLIILQGILRGHNQLKFILEENKKFAHK